VMLIEADGEVIVALACRQEAVSATVGADVGAVAMGMVVVISFVFEKAYMIAPSGWRKQMVNVVTAFLRLHAIKDPMPMTPPMEL
jgi:hypothetical protein